MTETLWTSERTLWCDGTDAFRALLHPEARMVFALPGPALDADAILEAITAAPRWSDVEITDRTATAFGDTTVLTYSATGQRAGERPYFAKCASVWYHTRDGWRIALHQQTPL